MRSIDPAGMLKVAMTLRVLIVDDNLQFLATARRLLEREGIAVVGVATTTAEARRHAEEDNPDVILVDVDLGEESGFELAEAFTQAQGKPLPVVMISTYPEQDLAELIETSSAIGFVPKSGLSARAITELLDIVD
jgi:two-component system, NarL family, nitrate/nitrite response regulator NarL